MRGFVHGVGRCLCDFFRVIFFFKAYATTWTWRLEQVIVSVIFFSCRIG